MSTLILNFVNVLYENVLCNLFFGTIEKKLLFYLIIELKSVIHCTRIFQN